jgi:hypothetical protein
MGPSTLTILMLPFAAAAFAVAADPPSRLPMQNDYGNWIKMRRFSKP